MLVDTHCHLDLDRFEADREEVIARAREATVSRLIIPGIDLDNCREALKLAAQHDGIFVAVGVHPNSTADWHNRWTGTLRDLARQPKVVAIGEIGLDYYWDESPRLTQHRALSAQLELAAQLNLPVIIHNRDASDDLVHLLVESPVAGRERAGVMHSFSADWGTAQAALNMGFYLGFSGPVTYKNSTELRDIVARAPLDRILIETDAPFQAPQQHRGRRNEPAYVALVAEAIAAIRGMEVAELARHTTENAERLFGIRNGT